MILRPERWRSGGRRHISEVEPVTREQDADAALQCLVIRASAGGLLGSIALSPRLWFNLGRVFPNFPLSGFLFPTTVDFSIYDMASPPLAALLVLALVGLLFRPDREDLLYMALASIALLVAADIHRLQPWLYQYALTFALTAVYVRRRNFSFRVVFCFMLFGTYFWSGLQKLNPAFLSDTYPHLLRALTHYVALPDGLVAAGFCVPIIETSLGIGLLLPPLRRAAGGGIVAMHMLILFLLGPLGLATNSVVWPWNLAMIVIVSSMAFTKWGAQPTRMWMRRSIPAGVIGSLLVFAPAFSFVGCWPSQLSMNVYSGNLTLGYVIMDRSLGWNVPRELRRFIHQTGNSPLSLSVSDWALYTLNVPPFPESAPLTHAGKSFCVAYLDGSGEVWLQEKRLLFTPLDSPPDRVPDGFLWRAIAESAALLQPVSANRDSESDDMRAYPEENR